MTYNSLEKSHKANYRNFAKNSFPYIIPPGIVMGIMLIVFWHKGIYPFGDMTVDFYDTGQLTAPLYHHLYDVMHGTKSFFFDWYTALGMNMSETNMLFSFLSPFNLFFYVIPRDMILQSLSYFTILKMMVISLSMYVFLNRTFKIHRFWKIIFATGYAFCGYVVHYYTNIQWLDIVAVFPLLILSALYLVNHKKPIPYCLALAACLMMNFYLASMILLFLFFVGGLYIIMFVPSERRRKTVSTFGFSTLISLALSAVVVLPGYIQMSQSTRFNQGAESIFGSLLRILNTFEDNNNAKWYILIGSALALVIIIYGMVRTWRSQKKTNVFFAASILLLSTPLFFENINLIWHGGSYVSFPLRFGFMITFILYSGACFYIGKDESLNALSNDTVCPNNKEPLFCKHSIKWAYICAGLASIPIVCIVMSKFYQRVDFSIYTETMFRILVIVFILYLISYFIVLNKRNRLINYRGIAVLALIGMMTSAYLFMPPNKDRPSNLENESTYIGMSNRLKDNLHISDSNLDRIKNPGNTLNTNYPFIMRHAALSNWTHTISADLQNSFRTLGYSTNFTRALDSGGTVFSDALLNIRQTLATGELDAHLHSVAGSYEEYTLYDHKYQLPFGMTAYESIAGIGNKFNNSFDLQNALFNGFSQEGPLIEAAVVSYNVTGDNNQLQVTCEINVSEKQALYFQLKKELSGLSFSVDGSELIIPTIKHEDNTLYPAQFSNNIICLGVYENKTVRLTIACPNTNNNQTMDDANAYFTFALVNLQKLEKFTSSLENYTAHESSTGHSVRLTVTGTQEKNILFLPIAYDPGWNCRINGMTADIIPLAGTFIGVRLFEGENDVELTFWPQGLATGAWISAVVAFLCLTGILLIFLSKRQLQHNKFMKRLARMGMYIQHILDTVAEKIFYILWGTGVVAVYALPIAYTLIMKWFVK